VRTAFESEGNSKSATPSESACRDVISDSSYGNAATRKQQRGWESPCRAAPGERSSAIAFGAGCESFFAETEWRCRDRSIWSSNVVPAPPRRLSPRSPRTTWRRPPGRGRRAWDEPGGPSRAFFARSLQKDRLAASPASMPLRADLLGLCEASDRETRFDPRRQAGGAPAPPLSSAQAGRLGPCSVRS